MSHKRNPCKTPKDEMATPPSLFKKLDDRFDFQIDAAATPENTLCPSFHSKDYPKGWFKAYEDRVVCSLGNALIEPWYKATYWCNPPYSKGSLDKFLHKGVVESVRGSTVVMLLPVDFSTAWWDWCMLASEWIRIKGRVHFNGLDGMPIDGSPLFDSVVVVFDSEERKKNGLVVSEMGWK